MKIGFGINAVAATVAVGALGATIALAAIELPPGPNRDLVYGQCRTCHDLHYLVESAGLPRDAWDDLLTSMRQYGMRIPQEQRGKILDYLGTYLGPNPPKPGAAESEQMASAASGEAVFSEQCVSCHQINGRGIPRQFPPLAGNRDLFLSPEFPVRVLLNGMEGKIEVGGKAFDSVMPPFDHLSDEQIAAVSQYIRAAWNNAELAPEGFKEVAAADVTRARQHMMSSAEVWSYRSTLK